LKNLKRERNASKIYVMEKLAKQKQLSSAFQIIPTGELKKYFNPYPRSTPAWKTIDSI